ncbi:Uncharacterized protein DAT39_004535, partial [Clarias magur]
ENTEEVASKNKILIKNKLIRKAGQVIGTNLDSQESILPERMLAKFMLLIINNVADSVYEHLIMQTDAGTCRKNLPLS